MSDYLDFQLILRPNIYQKGSWDISLGNCPIDVLAGTTATVQPVFTQQQLDRLRDHNGWPSSAELKAIGQSVWQSLMTPALKVAFVSCLAKAKQDHHGMRIIVSIVGEEQENTNPGMARLQELPVEALYDNDYLASSQATPVSRSFNFKSDIEPLSIKLPLRILAVVATPADKPAANFMTEKQTLQDALHQLIEVKSVELEFCEPPCKEELMKRLEKGFQVLHFIGHGAFDPVGDEISPRPHLCFVGSDGNSEILDDEKLNVILQDSGVRLVVLSACSSAAPTPQQVEETVSPFEGVAQKLITGNSGVSAVVAMQFDLENKAAVEFSKSFYSHLLKPGLSLDEIVTMGRKAIMVSLDAGHRAWVNPVLYWRSKGCKVFELNKPNGLFIEPDVQILIDKDNDALQIYLKFITNVSQQFLAQSPGPEAVAMLHAEIASWQAAVEGFQQDQSQWLGENLRLVGGSTSPGGNFQCRLVLRVQAPTQIGDVKASITFPNDKISYQSAADGANTPGNILLAGANPGGGVTLMLQDASAGNTWAPGDYELAVLNFQVKAGAVEPIQWIKVSDVLVTKDSAKTQLNSLNAVVYVIP